MAYNIFKIFYFGCLLSLCIMALVGAKSCETGDRPVKDALLKYQIEERLKVVRSEERALYSRAKEIEKGSTTIPQDSALYVGYQLMKKRNEIDSLLTVYSNIGHYRTDYY